MTRLQVTTGGWQARSRSHPESHAVGDHLLRFSTKQFGVNHCVSRSFRTKAGKKGYILSLALFRAVSSFQRQHPLRGARARIWGRGDFRTNPFPGALEPSAAGASRGAVQAGGGSSGRPALSAASAAVLGTGAGVEPAQLRRALPASDIGEEMGVLRGTDAPAPPPTA